MDKCRIVMIGTPYSKTSIFYNNFKRHLKNIEIIEVNLDNKINGIKPSFIEIDMQKFYTPTCSEFKKREEDATLKVADTN